MRYTEFIIDGGGTWTLNDIEIAQQAKMDKITEVAAKIGLDSSQIEQYGDYKAKIKLPVGSQKTKGKLILVTAINPTPPAGEGKSTVTVGLGGRFQPLAEKSNNCIA